MRELRGRQPETPHVDALKCETEEAVANNLQSVEFLRRFLKASLDEVELSSVGGDAFNVEVRDLTE